MQLLLPLLNRAAATWFSFVYHVSWQASLLAVLLLVVVLLGRRWPSPLRYWLLVLALAKFALPPLLAMPMGLFSNVGPAVQATPIEANFHTVALATPHIIDSTTPSERVPMGPIHSDPSPEWTKPVAGPPSSTLVLDGKAWLMLLHLFGALVAAFWILRSLFAMRRTLRRAAEVSNGELQRRFVRLSEQLGLRRPPRLLLSYDPGGPAAFGVLRPVVVLPDAVALLEASALDAILRMSWPTTAAVTRGSIGSSLRCRWSGGSIPCSAS